MAENVDIIKKISTANLKLNMVIAEDVVTKNGIVIIGKNTSVTESNIEKIKESGIKNIRIWTNDIEPDEVAKKHITQLPEFKEFAENYEVKIDTLKDTFSSILNGGTIDKTELEKIPQDICNLANCKSDLVKYVYYLNETDEITYNHSLNVCILANVLAKWLDMAEEECNVLTVAALLHDIGKLKISTSILNKKEKLTEQEFEILKNHSTLGYKMLENVDVSPQVKLAVLMHHEKLDGTGYPLGLKDSRISKYAKIISICDIYDALTTDKAYRNKICPFDAMNILETSGFGKLDTEFLRCFLDNVAYSYLGSKVKLSDSSEGEIVFINAKEVSRPIINQKNEFVNLSLAKNRELKILDIL